SRWRSGWRRSSEATSLAASSTACWPRSTASSRTPPTTGPLAGRPTRRPASWGPASLPTRSRPRRPPTLARPSLRPTPSRPRKTKRSVSAERLDGRVASAALVESLRHEIAGFGFVPRLDFVRVGDDPASAYYVRSKERLAARVGLNSTTHLLPEGTTADELLDLVARLNRDPEVDGVLVQLPVPGVDEKVVLDAIDPAKDVDGLHPTNVGRRWSGREALVRATPLGVIALCDHYGIDPTGANAVIVGRSNLVGKPLAALLLGRNA